MTDSEKLDLLLNNMQTISGRLDRIEEQVKQSERTLRNELWKSENLILDEVERIHDILDKHKEDKTVHTA